MHATGCANRKQACQTQMLYLQTRYYSVHAEKLIKSHQFVQCVIFGKYRVLSVILYTEEQISGIKRLCCNSLNARTTVLGFD